MSDFISFNEIIGNGKAYVVPRYQRDYAWEKDQWEDLWLDILDLEENSSHYIGYLVLKQIQKKPSIYEVIDGQQRLATLSILALAVTALLKEWSEKDIDKTDNENRAQQIIRNYVGNYSISALTLSPKLKLNRNNDEYYQNYLLKFRSHPALKKQKKSVQLLQQVFDYYYSELHKKFDNSKSGAELTTFFEDTIADKIIFTRIVVENDLEAFTVFETLNARGVKLSTADLLKNYIFSLINKNGELDLERAEWTWQRISDTLAAHDLTQYIKYFWNSRNNLVRDTALFKAIKAKITDYESAFAFLDDLERCAFYYTVFTVHTDVLWSKEEAEWLYVLDILNVTICYPLLLAVLNKLPREYFQQILKELANICLRNRIAKLNSNDAERIFASSAVQITQGRLTTVREIIESLQAIYVTDESFKQCFSELVISTNREKNIIKYLLIELENALRGDNSLNAETDPATIEHILPENPGEVWSIEFPDVIQDQFIIRFANYTLLEASINNKLHNTMPFVEKVKHYAQSKYKMTNNIASFAEDGIFNPERLKLRQEKLAKLAVSIWKSKYLG